MVCGAGAVCPIGRLGPSLPLKMSHPTDSWASPSAPLIAARAGRAAAWPRNVASGAGRARCDQTGPPDVASGPACARCDQTGARNVSSSSSCARCDQTGPQDVASGSVCARCDKAGARGVSRCAGGPSGDSSLGAGDGGFCPAMLDRSLRIWSEPAQTSYG